jgi:fatty-acyl-CoA synthase
MVTRESSMTLSSLLIKAIRRHGDRVALRVGDARMSYRELDELSSRLAAFLAKSGIHRGACVALHLRNGTEYVIADIAILKLGAVKVPLNELVSAAEMAHLLAHSGAEALISHASLPEPEGGCVDVAPYSGLFISVPDAAPARSHAIPWNAAIAPAHGAFEPADSGSNDTAMIMYTGGTTGLPKGVRHIQGRLADCLLAHVVCGEVRPDEVMLLTTPLPHSAGFHLQACLFQGGEAVLATRFETAHFLELARRHSITWTFAVPTMLYRLLDTIGTDGEAPVSLRTVIYGAAPMDAERMRHAIKRFGPIFIQLYGQTECPNYITTLTKEDHLDETLLKSCGRAVPFVDFAVRHEGRDCAAGDVGEVMVRGPYLLSEYYRDAGATRVSLVEGWLHTGDLGYRDTAGYLFLVDRVKDMIISGGMNVYSAEVEAVLRQHPAVDAVAVVGIPHPDWGEIVVAAVVPLQGADAEELRRFAKARLSAYKAPKHVIFVDLLPLTRVGKIDKKALRASVKGRV